MRAILIEIRGLTYEQYKACGERLGLFPLDSDDAGQLFKGELFHAHGPDGGRGWRFLFACDSDHSFQQFARRRLRPALRHAGASPDAVIRCSPALATELVPAPKRVVPLRRRVPEPAVR